MGSFHSQNKKQLISAMTEFAVRSCIQLGIDISRAEVAQVLAIDAIANPQRTDDVIIQGSAGTGKSWVIRQAVKCAEAAGLKALVCAPTNKAASLIDGVTVHAAFGLEAEPCLTPGGKTGKARKIKCKSTPAVKAADILIIDEMSMVRFDLLDAIVTALEKIGKTSGKRPRLVLVGDMLQLPPIVTSEDLEILKTYYKNLPIKTTHGKDGDKETCPGWIWLGEKWKTLAPTPYRLTVCKRTGDPVFAEIQARIGEGTATWDDLDYVNSNARFTKYEDDWDWDGESIMLMSWRGQVRKVNARAMEKLAENDGWSDWTETVKAREEYQDWYLKKSGYKDKDKLDLFALSGAPAREVTLREGMRVVFTAAQYEGPEGEKRAVCHNGDTGTVIKWDGRFKIINMKQNLIDEWVESVTVRMDNGLVQKIRLQEFPVYKPGATKKKIKRYQIGSVYAFPFVPGYAMTIHKSQGSTFSKVLINPDNFEAGQAYVMLTRCKSIRGITLTRDLRPEDIKVDKDARDFIRSKAWLPECLH